MATTHTDTNVNQLIINKLTKPEYDNLSQVSDTELYLVEESLDSTVTQGSTNPVSSGAVYEALHEIGSAINDGTTLFTKNNKTIGTISANQALDKTIKIPNDIIMCKMSDGIVYDSYITYTKIKQYLPDYPYYSDDLDWEIGGNPPTRANITADNYYLDVDTKHIFVADENLELLDITSSVVIQGDPNKLYCNVDTNKLYRYDGTDFIVVSTTDKEIVDNLIIAKDDANDWHAYPLEGTYIGWIANSTTPASFWDKQAGSLHTFTSEDSGKYFYDIIYNKVYVYISHSNSLYCCSDDGSLYHLENLDTTKTYLSYNTKILYRTDNGENFIPINSETKVSFTPESGTFSDIPLAADLPQSGQTLAQLITRIEKIERSLKKVAFSGSYNDLTDKLQNATTSAAGLMSASDKTQVANLTVSQISISTTLLCGRITGSGNYLEIFVPCALPSNASNLTLTITSVELYFDGTRTNLSYDSINNVSIIPLVGASFDLHLTSTQTPNKTFFVLLNGTLTFNR